MLKTLKSFIGDDNVNAAVITIPAKFKTDQIAATKRAAQLAGIEHCELLQEPIAASMAYGLSAKNKNGIWLVFDFGGGTFDAALIKVEDGVMQVKDTEGDNYLGGKNLDYAIVDEIIIPHLKAEYSIEDILSDETTRNILRDAMKFYAEQAKNQLSFKEKTDLTSQLEEFGEDDEGEEIELDLVITQDQLKAVISPIFQKSIDITQKLLERNNLNGSDLDSLILVGGPTHSPLLRQMLRDQITHNVDTSIDPMMAVALGAALFASSIDSNVKHEVASGTIALDINYPSNSVEQIEYVAVKLLPEECKGKVPNKVFIELTRSDKDWSSGKVEINEIGDVVECYLKPGRANAFKISAFDETGQSVPCFPQEINIMQCLVVGNAVLPYHIGVEVRDDEKSRDVFVPLKGLEKNQSLPAVGVKNGLRNPKQLRPGVSTDRLVIPIYQGEHDAEGTSAIYNDHVFDVIITGDDVPCLVPAQSEIDITIKVDSSQMMKLEAIFPVVGESVEKDVDVKCRAGVSEDELALRLSEAQSKMRALEASDAITDNEIQEAFSILSDVKNRHDSEKSSQDGRMHLLADLRRAFLAMEKIEKGHEWDTIEIELKEKFGRLNQANQDLGNKYDEEVRIIRSQVDSTLRSRDVSLGRATLETINEMFFRVTFVYQLIGCVRYYHNSFNEHSWKDPSQARMLLNKAMTMVNGNPATQELHELVVAFLELLDEETSDKIKF